MRTSNSSRAVNFVFKRMELWSQVLDLNNIVLYIET